MNIMEKKYKLTNTTKFSYNGIILYQIEALRTIKVNDGYLIVKPGERGGFIQGEKNLEQEGECWIFPRAEVFGEAVVRDNAYVYGESKVYGNAELCDHSSAFGFSRIFGNASLNDNSEVSGNSQVFDDARLFNNSKVFNGMVYGGSFIYGNAIICGGKIYDNARVSGDMIIDQRANIRDIADVLSISPMGSEQYTITFYRTSDNDIWIRYGRFNVSISDFERNVVICGDDKLKKDYMNVITLARGYFNNG